MKVAVIGGGPAGLVSIHQLKKAIPDANIVGYEISKNVGGVWLYTDDSGIDEYGVPHTSSMYKGLRANLPKQVMQFSDYPVGGEYDSYMSNGKFLEYINSYVDHFDIKRHIKFRHMVTAVKFNNDKWDVTVKNLPTGVVETETFDYVFVCNGHNSHYFMPTYAGIDNFKGSYIHSHNYRKPEAYTQKNVLTVGMGPSGFDITMELLPFANKVFASSRQTTVFPSDKVHSKPAIKEFTENTVVFVDGTTETIDSVIFCTGYKYYCPFLEPNTGVTIEPMHFTNIYRHIVNVEHPSMYFIGVPLFCCPIPLLDMQARYCAALLKGNFTLPTKDAMLEHIKSDYESKDKSKFKDPNSATHGLGTYETKYLCELAKESGEEKVPLIYHSMRDNSRKRAVMNLAGYRNFVYTIRDDNTFTTRQIGTDVESDPIYCDPNCENHQPGEYSS